MKEKMVTQGAFRDAFELLKCSDQQGAASGNLLRTSVELMANLSTAPQIL